MSTRSLDFPQVIKSVYNPETESLFTSPSYVDTTTWATLPASTTATTEALNVLPYKVVGVVVTWSGLDHTDGTVQFKGSVNGVGYDNIGSATTLSSASGHQNFALIDEPYKYIELTYTHGTNTTGSIVIQYILRA